MYDGIQMQDHTVDKHNLTSTEYLRKSRPLTGDASLEESMRESDYESAMQARMPKPSLEESKIAPGMYKPVPEMLVLEWRASSRPYKKRHARYFTTVLVIALLISLILFFAGQYLPIAVVISVVFLLYVQSVVPPPEVNYKITTYGIRIDSEMYYWQELGRFWFEEKFNQPQVVVEMMRFPGQISMVLGEITKKQAKDILSEVLMFERPPLTQYERLAKWLEKRLPLDME